MSKADKTRQFIIESTAELFNKKGYAGTSLSDISEATGLTKGSIYGNFANKDEVMKEVYNYNAKLVQSGLYTQLKPEMTSREKLMALTEYYRNSWESHFSRGGCPIMNTAVESDDTMPDLQREVAKSFKSWASRIAAIIDEGKSKGEIPTSVDSFEYSYLFIMLIEGGILLSKTTASQSQLNIALDRIRNIIDSELIK